MALATLLVASIAAIGAAGESMQKLVVSKKGTRDFIPRSVACLSRIPVAATYQADFAPEGRLLVQWQDEALLDAGQLALLEQVLTIGATAMGRIADARDVGERLTAGSFTPQLIKQLSQAGLLRAVFNDLAYFSTQTLVEEKIPHTASTTPGQTSLPTLWGLDRIDQRALPYDFLYGYDYVGGGVDLYVVDTGIDPTHTEFQTAPGSGISRVILGPNFADDQGPWNSSDCFGHGSHVSGIAGGLTYGVAKDVTLIAVRVLDCSGEATARIVCGAATAANLLSQALSQCACYGGCVTALSSARACFLSFRLGDGPQATATPPQSSRGCSGFSPTIPPRRPRPAAAPSST
jgi:subtilisin family serine protease